jgi:hypothetical protein
MNKNKAVATVALALTLLVTGCSGHSASEIGALKKITKEVSHVAESATDSPTDSVDDSEDPTNGDTPDSTDIPVPSETDSNVVTASSIHSVHSPTNVVNDMHLTSGQCHIRTVDATSGKYLPDANCTPGGIDPAVTQQNIASTICKSGYTKTVRASDTEKFKVLSLNQYGIKSAKTTEYDHLISLQLGGTNSVSNLWVEPNKANAKGTNNPKDAVETKLKVAVCAHKITLDAAQRAIASDRTTAESKLGI